MRKSIVYAAPTEWVRGGPVLGLPPLQGSDDECALAAKIREAGLRRLFSSPSGLDIRAQHEVLRLVDKLCRETSAAVIIARRLEYMGREPDPETVD